MLVSKVFAWLVHAFTASGIIPALYAIVAISQLDFLSAFLWLMLAHFIDGVDGTLARMARVQEVLPWMSGKMMDSVIDFSTYALIPAYALFMAPNLWPNEGLIRHITVCVILLVSTLYYGKEGMVSDDYYFVGFPVLWNWVAFYLLYIFTWSQWMNIIFIWACAILHFVPIKVLYPSRAKTWKKTNLMLFFVLMFSCLISMLVVEEKLPSFQNYLFIARSLASALLVYFFGFGIASTLKESKDLAQ